MRAAELLAPFMAPGRMERLEAALERRTSWITVVLDDLYHPHNMSAVVRSCEAMGIQDLHAVELSNPFDPSHGVALGAEQWVTIHRHRSIAECFQSLEEGGYRCLCADPPRRLEGQGGGRPAYAVEEIPLDRPVALIFGRERDGLHQETRERSHATFYIPMWGLTESLNVSVTAAVALYTLRKRLEREVDPALWRLPPQRRRDLLDQWAMTSVRHSREILRRLQGGE